MKFLIIAISMLSLSAMSKNYLINQKDLIPKGASPKHRVDITIDPIKMATDGLLSGYVNYKFSKFYTGGFMFQYGNEDVDLGLSNSNVQATQKVGTISVGYRGNAYLNPAFQNGLYLGHATFYTRKDAQNSGINLSGDVNEWNWEAIGGYAAFWNRVQFKAGIYASGNFLDFSGSANAGIKSGIGITF